MFNWLRKLLFGSCDVNCCCPSPPPVYFECCSRNLAATLSTTIIAPGCAVDGAMFTISHNSGTGKWEGTTTQGGTTITVKMRCEVLLGTSAVHIEVICDGGSIGEQAAAFDCGPPFTAEATFTTGSCGCGGPGSLTVEITE